VTNPTTRKYNEVFEITVSETGSRVRLSTSLLEMLGWTTLENGFECLGIFRRDGEMICAPEGLKTQDGVHPFQSVLDIIEAPQASTTFRLREVPRAATITAGARVIKFETSWVSPQKKQLNLKLGVTVMSRLGWSASSPCVVYTAPWGAILLIMSSNRYGEVRNEDFTGGELNL